MATIVTRAGKGSPLTNNEVDANFENLNAEVTPLRHSIRPSLLLDFANSKQLDPRITFSRASTGTYYDGKTFAKAEENLLIYSQDFNLWSAVSGTVVANNAVAPDGTTTADTFTCDGGSFAGVYRSVPTITDDFVFSIWIRVANGSGFDVDIGTDNRTNYTRITPTTSWQRFTATTSYLNNRVRLELVGSTNGDAIELWGAQLEQRDSVTAYTPTTDQPITNYIPVLQTAAAGTARFDHDPVTGESKGLLIEEQRTNLLTYSEDFSNAAWSKSGGGGATITSNIIVAPDGNLTGDKLIPNAATSSGFAANQLVSTSDATFSVFAKAGEKDKIMLFGASKGYGFDLTSGTTFAVGGITASDSATITDVGNGWYKCSIYVSGSWTRADIYVLNSTSYSSYTGDGYSGIYIWGAQLEAGAFPTSYIKTTSAQATRNADAASMTGTNFSSWYRQDEGTLYGEGLTTDLSNRRPLFLITDGTNSNRVETDVNGGSGVGVRFTVITNGSAQADLSNSTISVNTNYKVVGVYKRNDFAGYRNGTSFGNDPSGILPVVTRTDIGYRSFDNLYLNGTIKKLAYYPTRLTNAEITALTEE